VPSRPRSLSEPQELAPEDLRLAVGHGDPQHLAVAKGVDADGHHHRPRHHLQVAAKAAVEVGGVQVDVGETGMVQRPAQEGLDLLVEALADAVTSALEMPLVPPSASTPLSTLRVEIPPL
jgi:hypothetical protein